MDIGIPPLLNNASQAVANVGLLVADAKSIAGMFGASVKWGIFSGGKAVLTPDSVMSMEYKQEWRIVDYPMEKGAFETYNKVNSPFDARVRVTKGGTVAARQAFLDTIDGLSNSLLTYEVVTPEKTYKSVNVSHYDYRREAMRGNGLLTVDIWLMEIRQTVIPVYTSSKAITAPAAPSGADPLVTGTVQPQLPSTDQLAQIQASVVGPITDTISAAVTNATPAVAGAVSNLSSTLSATLSSAASTLTPALSEAMSSVNTALAAAAPGVEAQLSGALSGLSANMAGLNPVFPQITDAMNALGESVKSSIGSINIGGH